MEFAMKAMNAFCHSDSSPTPISSQDAKSSDFRLVQLPDDRDQSKFIQNLDVKLNFTNKKGYSHHIIFNVSGTKYDSVKEAGNKMPNWQLSMNPKIEWTVAWIDCVSDLSRFSKLKPFQRVNCYPGIQCLTRKDGLSINLMQQKKRFPQEFDFFPETFVLPVDFVQFKAQCTRNRQNNAVYIVKPQASSQGKGIFLTKTWSNIPKGNFIAQKYLAKPYLLDGLKFDLRIYVLITSCDPLKIYVFEDGLARFATEPYEKPTTENLEDMYMHLTNYAINKNNPEFIFNNSAADDSTGHKRSLKALFKSLEERGHDVKDLWKRIKEIITKTFCSVQPILSHKYKSIRSEESASSVCFQILGFDVMLDEELKPWLLEVNGSPSFTTDTPLDKSIKERVIGDALRLLNLSPEDKLAHRRKQRIETNVKNITGKSIKQSKQEKETEIKLLQQRIDEWEANNCGGYQRVFPPLDPVDFDMDKYNLFIKGAAEAWMSPFEFPPKRINFTTTEASPSVRFGAKKIFVPERNTPKLYRPASQMQKTRFNEESSVTGNENSRASLKKEALKEQRPQSALETLGSALPTSLVIEKAFETERVEVLHIPEESVCNDLDVKEETDTIIESQPSPKMHLSSKKEPEEKACDNPYQQIIPKLPIQEGLFNSTKLVKKASLDSERQKNKPKDPSSDPSRIMRILQRCGSISEDKTKQGLNNKLAKASSGQSTMRSWNDSAGAKNKKDVLTHIPPNSYSLFYSTCLTPMKQNLLADSYKTQKLYLPKRFGQNVSKDESRTYVNSVNTPKREDGSLFSRLSLGQKDKGRISPYKENTKQKVLKNSRDQTMLLFVPGVTYHQAKTKTGNFLMPKLFETSKV